MSYDDCLVGKRVLAKDSCLPGSIVQDNTLNPRPYFVIRFDTNPNLLKVVSMDDIILIGEVQK